MTAYFVEVTICDDLGANCQSPVMMPSTEIPTSTSWFGLEAGSDEYWDVVTAFVILMATAWAARAIIKFIRK